MRALDRQYLSPFDGAQGGALFAAHTGRVQHEEYTTLAITTQMVGLFDTMWVFFFWGMLRGMLCGSLRYWNLTVSHARYRKLHGRTQIL